MNQKVEQVISNIIQTEGGYVDHKNDKGGATCWGITEKVARSNGYNGEMRNLPLSFARDIYYFQYVIAPGFDKVVEISPKIAEELIDSGVNMGVQYPCLWLQQTLNLLNKDQTLYPDITEDGVIGPKTLDCLNLVLKQRNGVESVILKCLNILQGSRYIEITKARKANESFFLGWLNNRINV